MTPARPTTKAAAPTAGQRTDEIRKIAGDLFWERGYSSTTMTHIADAVGIFPGSLYHHFASKEEIAVEILQSFDRDLNELGTSVKIGAPGSSPEADVEQLLSAVISLSFDHGAAVRLRRFEPPTVSTSRLHEARTLHAPALDRAWKKAIDRLADTGAARGTDAGLLRFALKELALDAAGQFPQGTDPAELAQNLSRLLLYGIAQKTPSDDELDRSAASVAASEALASWTTPDEAAEANDVRAQIIAAARGEFAKRGYDATTIRDVAEAAGVHMGTLYRRVESKEAILAEVLAPYAESLDTAIRAALTTGDSEVASIDALAKVFVHGRRRFRQESDIVTFGWRELAEREGPLHDYQVATQERLVLLETLLKRGFRKGTLRKLGSPSTVAPYIRFVIWTPYQDFGRTSEAKSLQFLRSTLLRGFLNR